MVVYLPNNFFLEQNLGLLTCFKLFLTICLKTKLQQDKIRKKTANKNTKCVY